MEKDKRAFDKRVIVVSAVTSVVCFLVLFALAAVFVSQDGVMDAALRYLSDRGSDAINKKDPVYNDVAAEESLIIDIVESTNPAVVSIVITRDVPIIEEYYLNPFGNDFFEDFFGGFGFRIPQQRQNGTERREVGGGSGFFVSPDGLIVTNRHVVDDSGAEYTVLTNDGQKYDAEVLAKDAVLDVAILKVNDNNLPYLEFGNSDLLRPGQTVIAIGNALAEFRNSVSVGVVSGLSRSIVAGDSYGRSELLEGVIQTDAAINPGNSGGPLIDLSGNVIGINVAVQMDAQNIGFALPGNTVKSIVESVKEYGEIVRPYLGVRYIRITETIKQENNLPVGYGALVQRGETAEQLAVIPGSPADKAGILENDIILEVDGEKVGAEKSLASIVRQKQAGQTIQLKILRKGEELKVEVELERAPDDF